MGMRMRAIGFGFAVAISLGCLSALEDTIEAGPTDFQEIIKIPTTELTAVIPENTLKPGDTEFGDAKTRVSLIEKESARVSEKHAKTIKAQKDFVAKKQQYLKAQ